MKAMLYTVALVASLAVTTLAHANPALMKKDRPGYPSEGTKATDLYGSSALEGSVANEPKDGAFADQNKAIRERDNLRRGETRLPVVTDPGYVSKGVMEDHIKDATKIQAEPR